jgi:DNA-binding transcriptional MerR regulator
MSDVETTTSLANKAGTTAETVRLYTQLGLIECQRLPNGVRLYRSEAVARVKAIFAERMARRGGARTAIAST